MNTRLVAAAILLAASSASADSTATQVFPLSGWDLPVEQGGAPTLLTQAIVDDLGAELSSVAIEDAAGLLECDIETTACLEAVSRSIGGKQLVFGTIATTTAGGLAVTLTRFQPGRQPERRTYELTTKDHAAELLRSAGPLLGHQPKAAPQPTALEVVTAPDAPARIRGSITAGTWALIGAGLVVAGAGLGFHVSASGIREDVANAPRNTVEDFQQLVTLEDRGRLRTRLGTALIAGGGIAVIAGAVRAYLQLRGEPAREGRELTVVPLPGGAAVTMTWGLR